MQHGPLRAALEVTIKSDAKLRQNRHAAIVSLCRILADQVDDSGTKASSHLTASYLSALKDLQRAMGEDKPKEAGGGKLGHLRAVEAAKSA